MEWSSLFKDLVGREDVWDASGQATSAKHIVPTGNFDRYIVNCTGTRPFLTARSRHPWNHIAYVFHLGSSIDVFPKIVCIPSSKPWSISGTTGDL